MKKLFMWLLLFSFPIISFGQRITFGGKWLNREFHSGYVVTKDNDTTLGDIFMDGFRKVSLKIQINSNGKKITKRVSEIKYIHLNGSDSSVMDKSYTEFIP